MNWKLTRKVEFVFIILIILIISITYITKKKNGTLKYLREIKETQVKISEYIIDNYEGIETIEWNGWFELYAPFSIKTYRATYMTINGYNHEENGSYSYHYIVNKHIDNIELVDRYLQVDPYYENIGDIEAIQKEFRNQGVKKSKVGSPNAKITYNINELE
ncbi:hypothetical protein [Miniphocaeibacter massiliensis]|uniref:hypothetical protein n=1 Tax=Miniphocaeibacter massiliensis TaxID=2041841 RepID=UPI000C06B8F1|nr:hypothetical protein [Miniphocaeibacter massiliensis]